MAKKNNHMAPWLLFLISAALLSAGWLMRPFPSLMLFGFAPLFSIIDQVDRKESFWTNIEFILLGLGVSFFAAHHFHADSIIVAMVQAIIFAFAFLGYTFAHQQLGDRLGKFTIIFFWLALEYVMVKLPWRNQFVFLADAFDLRGQWTRWTFYTGYLGISLWVLITGLLTYLALLRSGINWYWLVAVAIVAVAPIIFSHYVSQDGINHLQMTALYEGGKVDSSRYAKEGELVSRTGAWISVIILLLAFVKTQTKKK